MKKKRRKRVTIEDCKNFLRHKLSTDEKWAIKALMILFSSQTFTERTLAMSTCRDGVGFSTFDAEALTSIARYFKAHGTINKNQSKVLMLKIPKYWRQIYDISDMKKLGPMACNYRDMLDGQETFEFAKKEDPSILDHDVKTHDEVELALYQRILERKKLFNKVEGSAS